MTKRIIYAFYIDKTIESFDNCLSYRMHFNGLRHFSKVFNKATFIISVNDLENPLIKQVKDFIYSNFSHCDDLNIIVEQNDPDIREAKWYCKYVINKLDQYDGYVWFGHSKGVKNELYDDTLNTLWIASMYYFNLMANPEDVIGDAYYGYGFPYVDHKMNVIKDFIRNADNNYQIANDESILNMYDDFKQKQALRTKFITHDHCWLYSGSCYWMNPKKIHQYIIDNNLLVDYLNYIPWWFNTIMTAEMFMPDLFSYNDVNYPYKENRTNFLLKDDFDYYNADDFLEYLKIIVPDDDLAKFLRFHDEMTTIQ